MFVDFMILVIYFIELITKKRIENLEVRFSWYKKNYNLHSTIKKCLLFYFLLLFIFI